MTNASLHIYNTGLVTNAHDPTKLKEDSKHDFGRKIERSL